MARAAVAQAVVFGFDHELGIASVEARDAALAEADIALATLESWRDEQPGGVGDGGAIGDGMAEFAGAVEAVACVMAIGENLVPPTINHTTVDEEIDPKLNLTLNKAQAREVRVAMSNTFGFGGHNACVLLKKIS